MAPGMGGGHQEWDLLGDEREEWRVVRLVQPVNASHSGQPQDESPGHGEGAGQVQAVESKLENMARSRQGCRCILF